MSSFDQFAHDEDERFERRLLDSARSDELPTDVAAAWAKLGAGLLAASTLTAGSTGAAVSARLGRFAAVRWLVIGFIAGSALTALVGGRLVRSQSAAHNDEAPSASSAPSAFVVVAPAREVVLRAPDRETSVPPRVSERAPQKISESARANAPHFSLGAQVALLDAARAALAAGDAARVLELTAHYEHEFPRGQLAPDAEVVALEALAQRGATSELAARAARFLARYPGDPHTARVQALLERE